VVTERITFISDDVAGGAAIACRRLIRGLRSLPGNDVSWVALRSRGEPDVIPAGDWPGVLDMITSRLTTHLTGSESVRRRAVERVGDGAVFRAVCRQAPQVVHLHGLHEGLSFSLVERLAERFPLVWTLHDMWPLTGYCYYAFDCEKYANGCQGECAQLGRCGAAPRRPAVEWQRRDRFFACHRERCILVAPSRWMAACARERFGGRVRVEHIANGLDLEVFRPHDDRLAVRRALGLPPGQKIILTGAQHLGEERKGGTLFREALRRLAQTLPEPLLVVTFGAGVMGSIGSVRVHAAGTIRDEAHLALYYNAADVFVSTALADNLPNTVMESIACGTPVVAFDVGGCGDLVREGQSGFLVPPGDVGVLADRISRALKAAPEEGADWRSASRRIAETDYSEVLQARRYATLYGQLGGVTFEAGCPARSAYCEEGSKDER
jgi:glycosyltransferase involved in cell wall biosynthesis